LEIHSSRKPGNRSSIRFSRSSPGSALDAEERRMIIVEGAGLAQRGQHLRDGRIAGRAVEAQRDVAPGTDRSDSAELAGTA